MAVALPMRPIDLWPGWLDTDLFTEGLWFARSTDEQIALLNNYWHQLEREAQSAGLRGSLEYRRLTADMDNWWSWKRSYDAAVFRRAASAPFQLWGGGLQAQYERELGAWRDRFLEDLNAILEIAPQAREGLVDRGVDPELRFQEFPDARGGDASVLVGVGVVVALVGFGAWASYRMKR